MKRKFWHRQMPTGLQYKNSNINLYHFAFIVFLQNLKHHGLVSLTVC